MDARIPPQANVVVCNVFFSKRPFYIFGAELMHVYPMSIAVHGQGFGLVGAANVLRHIEAVASMLIEAVASMLPEALVELEAAYGISA